MTTWSNERAILNTIAVGCVIIFMLMLWCVDISVSGILHEKSVKALVGISVEATLTNGFWSMNPMQAYHIAMYGMIAVVSLLVMLNILMAHRVGIYDKDNDN